MIIIYTDGSSRGNPGPGGYGTVLKYKEHRKELSEGFRKTTNNRMELLAVIMGLEAINVPNAPVTVYSDSKYVIDSVEKGWLWGWIKKGFKGKKNKDLWLRFAEVYKKHRVTFQWVKGHAGNIENERCDELAVEAAMGSDLKVDTEFENGINDF
ncbi:RNase HI [Roseivirga ehrenbergii]|uniref:ribonuclease H n=1 Tax=Roseivirga ehrenbergii (strain DSM 102268 / JCM 13514 / KCTC 12282 / NCIMB 14502 / KMM 6017) TaxID=279360 RepID=A0A150WYI1_ROSEK|nr:ribonuclease HI [Roseivirga ehrenbergii]KYG71342.1 ribonuclease HI [Roseivirga ehrenbergii]TCK99612.1 RNase HI [Roseivirga ehrenbergii]